VGSCFGVYFLCPLYYGRLPGDRHGRYVTEGNKSRGTGILPPSVIYFFEFIVSDELF